MTLEAEPSAEMLAHVAQQVDVNPNAWTEYAARDETRREHALELQSVFGYRSFTIAEYRKDPRNTPQPHRNRARSRLHESEPFCSDISADGTHAKATAMSPSPPWPANSWSRSGPCSRATRLPRWKPTKASLSNSISLLWCWAPLCAASSDLVTRCPLASAHFEAERFKLPIPHPENERTRTNQFDGGHAPPNPRTARRGRRSGGTSPRLACGKPCRKKTKTREENSCMTTCLASADC